MNTKEHYVSALSSLWAKLAASKEYRHAFVASELKRGLPRQIRVLRTQREWNQKQLASEAGLTQGAISRAEDPDYGNLTLNNLLRIGRGLDVAFVGRFVPFSELARWHASLTHESQLKVPSFDDDIVPDVRVGYLGRTGVARPAAASTTYSLADLLKPLPEMLRSVEWNVSVFLHATGQNPQKSTLVDFARSLWGAATTEDVASPHLTLQAVSQPRASGALRDEYKGLHLVSFKQPPDGPRMKAVNPAQAA